MGTRAVGTVCDGGVGAVPAAGVALAVTETLRGGAINQVKVVTEDAAQQTNSTTFVYIPGAVTTLSVPKGEKGLIPARFSAESACFGGTGANNCSVMIVVVNNATGVQTEACPCNQFANFEFDSTGEGTEILESQESHSMDRSLDVGRGTYTVKTR